MSLEALCEIARVLDCSSDELLGLELKNTSLLTAAADLLEMATGLCKGKGKEAIGTRTPGPLNLGAGRLLL